MTIHSRFFFGATVLLVFLAACVFGAVHEADAGRIATNKLQDPDPTQQVFMPMIEKYHPDWDIVTTMNFESDFPGAWSIANGSTTYKWAKRDCDPFQDAYSGWAVGGGAGGSALVCEADYPDNVETWLVYGPFSLVGATAAHMQLQAFINVQPDSQDRMCWMASVNGTSFSGYCVSEPLNAWSLRTLNLASAGSLGSLLGQSQVWVALYFRADATSHLPVGAQADNIVIRRCLQGACSPITVSGPALSASSPVIGGEEFIGGSTIPN